MTFSIITVNYNHCEGLLNTLRSIISQNYSDYEIIVIDGGSDDGSVDIIRQYSKHISYWVSERDNGIYNGMNKGIAQAKGIYVNFMNSGDTFYDDEVLNNVSKMNKNNDFLIGRDYNEDPHTHNIFKTILPTRISMATFFVWTLPHQSAFIRRSLFADSPYDETLKIVADWKFYIVKIVYEGKSVQLMDLIVSNREQGGISVIQAQKTIEERSKVLSELLPPGIYKDYESLARLDRSTLYKLLNLIDQDKGRRWIILFVKILNRILHNS